MSEKIRTQHLQRKAILYVRQSSAYQVMHNLESQKLQYAMELRLQQLGWGELGWGEIEVIDEDLGQSAAGSVTRTGFERMVPDLRLTKQTRGEKFFCMNRRSFLGSSAALVGVGVLGQGASHADSIHSHHAPAASLMTECANRFLAGA